MTQGFVWFHNGSDDPSGSAAFYEKLVGWKPSAGPAGLTMLANESGPIAAVAQRDGSAGGWIPYVQVDNVDAATAKAAQLGATILSPKSRGPAGEFSIVRDPGGAALGLWQKA